MATPHVVGCGGALPPAATPTRPRRQVASAITGGATPGQGHERRDRLAQPAARTSSSSEPRAPGAPALTATGAPGKVAHLAGPHRRPTAARRSPRTRCYRGAVGRERGPHPDHDAVRARRRQLRRHHRGARDAVLVPGRGGEHGRRDALRRADRHRRSRPTAPAAPVLAATAGNGHVQLSWPLPADGGSPLTGFTVARGTTSGGETTLTTLGRVGHVVRRHDRHQRHDLLLQGHRATTASVRHAVERGERDAAHVERRVLPAHAGARSWTRAPATARPARRSAGGVARSLQVTGRGGVPASGVSAVVMNVTVTNPSVASHVTVWPSGTIPNASEPQLRGRPDQAQPGHRRGERQRQGQLPTRRRFRRSHRRRRGVLRRRHRRRRERRALLAAGAVPHPRLARRHRRIHARGGAASTRDLTLTGVPNDADRGRAQRHRHQPDRGDVRHALAVGVGAAQPGVEPQRGARADHAQPGDRRHREQPQGEPLQRRRHHRLRRRRGRLVRRHHRRQGSSRPRPRRVACSTRGSATAFSSPWTANQTRDLTVAGNGPVPGDADRGGDERDRHQPDRRRLRHHVPLGRSRARIPPRTSTSCPARRCRTW